MNKDTIMIAKRGRDGKIDTIECEGVIAVGFMQEDGQNKNFAMVEVQNNPLEIAKLVASFLVSVTDMSPSAAEMGMELFRASLEKGSGVSVEKEYRKDEEKK